MPEPDEDPDELEELDEVEGAAAGVDEVDDPLSLDVEDEDDEPTLDEEPERLSVR